MGRTKCDASIDTTRAPKLLDVHASNKPAEAVTNEIDAPAADVLPKVFTQRKCALLDPCAGAVVEGKHLPEATETEIRGRREQGRAIREVSVYQYDGPLIRLARCAATRAFDPEGKERGCCANAKSLLRDRAPSRSFGQSIVLDHRVSPHPEGTLAVAADVLSARLPAPRPGGSKRPRSSATSYRWSIGRRNRRSLLGSLENDLAHERRRLQGQLKIEQERLFGPERETTGPARVDSPRGRHRGCGLLHRRRGSRAR